MYNSHNQDQVETYYCRIDWFKHSFFPYTIAEWNKLDITLRNTKFSQLLIFSCIAIILRNFLKDSVQKISNDISILTDTLVNLLLYGSKTYNFEEHSKIKASIKYILSTEGFSDPIM